MVSRSFPLEEIQLTLRHTILRNTLKYVLQLTLLIKLFFALLVSLLSSFFIRIRVFAIVEPLVAAPTAVLVPGTRSQKRK
jgi:hypothetical protein